MANINLTPGERYTFGRLNNVSVITDSTDNAQSPKYIRNILYVTSSTSPALYVKGGSSSGNSTLYIESEGSSDPILRLSVGSAAAENWVVGIDNSDNDTFKIHNGTSIGSAATLALAIDINENISIPGNVSISGSFALGGIANTVTTNALYYNPTTKQVTYGASGSGGGGGTPGGSDTQIQYNNAGAFGGVSVLTWDGTTLRATGSFTGSLTGIATSGSSILVSNTPSTAGTYYPVFVNGITGYRTALVDNSTFTYDTTTNTLTVTASYATNALTASIATTALTASYTLTASYFSGSIANSINTDNIKITDNPTYGGVTYYPTFVGNTSGYTSVLVDSSLFTYNPSTNILSTTSSYAITASYAETASFSLATTENRVLALNQSGNTISKGVVVRITGSNTSSDIPRIVTASYENDNNSANTLGITFESIANGATGFVTTEGILAGVNTNAFVSGQLIYLGATGSIIGTAPQSPLHSVRLGEVVRHQTNNGSIYVRIDNGYEIEELHDVLITSASSGDLLVRSGSVWTNSKQLSGSYAITGSLTSTSITTSNATISGNVTVSGTASINTLIVNQIGYSSGSNQLGDAVNDTQTLFGTVVIPTGSLIVTGSATVTGSVLTPTVFSDFLVSRNSILGNTNVRTIKPLSIGTTAGFSASNTGSIRIVTPGRGNSHMIKYIFDVYSYGGTETTVEAWGYDNGGWANATAKSSNPNILVRFAYDNTGKAVIYIGSYTQNWGAYAPSIVVREVELLGWQGNIATSASLYYEPSNYQFAITGSSGTDTIYSTITNTGYNVLSALTASYVNPLNQTVQITGSVVISGSATTTEGSYTTVPATLYVKDSIGVFTDANGTASINLKGSTTNQGMKGIYFYHNNRSAWIESFTNGSADSGGLRFGAFGSTVLTFPVTGTGSFSSPITAPAYNGSSINSGTHYYNFNSSEFAVRIASTRLGSSGRGDFKIQLSTAGGNASDTDTFFYVPGTNKNISINSGITNIGAQLGVRGSGTTSATNTLLIQNANASSSFQIRDNGDSIFYYPGVAGYSLKISGSYSGNGTSAIYETLGGTGAYYGIHEFRTGTNLGSSTRTLSIIYGGRVVIGNKSNSDLQFPKGNLLVDTNYINTFSGADPNATAFNTGIVINPTGSIDTKITASGIQFNFGNTGPNDNNGGAFLGSQWNPLTNGYDSDLIVYATQASAGSYTEIARFVGKRKSLSLGAGRNPSASLHISGASSAALLEIDSSAVNNILYVSGSGLVGINTGTPSSTLDVSGSGRFTNGLTVTGSLIVTGGITGSLQGTASFATTASFYGGSVTSASFASTAATASYVNPLNQTVIVTGSLIVSGSSTFTNIGPAIFSGSITQTASTASFGGLVGIGTTTPAYKLDVNGNTRVQTLLKIETNTDGLTIEGDASGYPTLKINNLRSGTTRRNWMFATEQINAGDFILYRSSTGGGAANTLVYSIFNDGNFGLNTSTNAGYKLDVNGTARFTDFRLTDNTVIAAAYTTGGTPLTIATTGHNNATGISTTSAVGIRAYSNLGVNNNNLLGASIYAAGGSSGTNISLGLLSNRALITNAASGLSMHTSSMLQVDSTTQGFLPPRTNLTSNISTPAQGLMTYITGSGNGGEGLYYYNSGSLIGWHKILSNSGSQSITGSLIVTGGITGSIASSSFASTASYVNTLNQNVLITGSLIVGSNSLGANENTLTLGPSLAGGTGEGGQLGFNAPGGTYTSASMLDNYQNRFRLLRGTNAGSDAEVVWWNMHTKQMSLPAYTNASSFTGTATANLAVDSSGNVITVSTTGGTVFPYTGNAVITGSLTTTGIIYAQPNGGMYFQGGDDAALYDINVANTMGVYGVQTVTEGAIKLGSNGPVLHGSGSRLGLGTTTPTSASFTVDGNVWATSFTGSLSGTAATASFYAGTVTSASFATTAKTAETASKIISNGSVTGGNHHFYISTFEPVGGSVGVIQTSNLVYNSSTNTLPTTASWASRAITASFYGGSVTSASFASTASYVNTLTQDVVITGSLDVNGNTNVTGNAGFGTNAPTVRVEIDAADNGGQRALKIRNTDSGSLAFAAVDFKTTNNDPLSIIQFNDTVTSYAPGDVVFLNQAVGANMWFGNSGNTDKLVISNGNNVGIGYSVGNTPNVRLGVSGSVSIVQDLTIEGNAGNTLNLNYSTQINGYDSTNNKVLSYDGNASPTMQLGYIDGANLDMTVNQGFIEVLDNQIIAASAAQWVNPTAQGTIITLAQAGEQIFPQQLLFLSSSGQWYKADADSADTSTSLLGICLTEAEANDSISVLLEGHYSTITYHDQVATPATIGAPLYVSTNAGYVTETAPTGTGDIVRLIGHNLYGELGNRGPDWVTVRFKPDNTWIEI